jgi:hypothetical protein
MPETKVLAPLLEVLADLIAWLKAEEVAGVVIGGLAASLLGRPRLTRDVDVLVMVDEGRWAGFLATGAKYGFVPRQRDTLAFAQQSRVLISAPRTERPGRRCRFRFPAFRAGDRRSGRMD